MSMTVSQTPMSPMAEVKWGARGSHVRFGAGGAPGGGGGGGRNVLRLQNTLRDRGRAIGVQPYVFLTHFHRSQHSPLIL